LRAPLPSRRSKSFRSLLIGDVACLRGSIPQLALRTFIQNHAELLPLPGRFLVQIQMSISCWTFHTRQLKMDRMLKITVVIALALIISCDGAPAGQSDSMRPFTPDVAELKQLAKKICESSSATLDFIMDDLKNLMKPPSAQPVPFSVMDDIKNLIKPPSGQPLPFSVDDNVDHPISLYAASKKANELMAHSYSHLYRIPCTGLRFFTVYGPWYRPDMALFVFADAIVRGDPVKLFNGGRMLRDFTYVDDVTEALVRLIDRAPQGGQPGLGGIPDPGSSSAPWRIYNVGNNKPQELLRVLDLLEQELGRKANKEMLPMQPGDVPTTYADVDDLVRDVDFRPSTPIEDGIHRFASWYRGYCEA